MLKNLPLGFLLLFAILHNSTIARAQPSQSTGIAQVVCRQPADSQPFPVSSTLDQSSLRDWAKSYKRGDWHGLQDLMHQKLQLPPSNTIYSVVFVSDGQAFRVLYYTPQQPYLVALPGVTELSQVQLQPTTAVPLTPGTSVTFISPLTSTCVWQKQADPTKTALSALVKGGGPAPALAVLNLSGNPPPATNGPVVATLTTFTNIDARSAIVFTDVTPDSETPLITTYANQPPVHLAIGAMTGLVIGKTGPPQVTNQGGKVNANPLRGATAGAIVEWHPCAFDPQDEQRDFRFFGGLVATPSFGVAAGFGYGIYGGLSLQVGYAAVRIDALRSGDTISEPPIFASHPFRTAVGGVVFVGLGFALGPSSFTKSP